MDMKMGQFTTEELRRPDVFQYIQFLEFLNDYLAFSKKAKGLTKRRLSDHVGVSESLFSMILSGKRSMSEQQCRRMSEKLGLNRSEVSYLIVLLKLNDESSWDQKIQLVESLRRFKSYQEQNPIEAASAKYLSQWFYVAIREMSYKSDFQLNTKWISKQLLFSVPAKDIEAAIQFLEKNQFIEIDKLGNIQLKHQPIECRKEALVPALSQFHSQMLKIAVESIAVVPSNERRIVGHTQLVSEETAQKAMEILEKAQREVVELISNSLTQEGRIFHFGVVAFPLSKKVDGDKKS